ncbi:MAG: WG repeat-containing protein [Chloracidobacterium sp.]|nr:WG repeat-containing protein [Chloracidobacterium sp.]
MIPKRDDEPQFDFRDWGRMAVVRVDGKFGYLNSLADFAIEPKFDFAKPFSEGFAIVGVDGLGFLGYQFRRSRSIFIKKDGVMAFPLSTFFAGQAFSEGLAKVWVGKEQGFINNRGEFVIPPRGSDIGEFHEGYATIWSDNRLGYVNASGEIVIPAQFKQAGQFSEGIAPVAFESGKYGFIDKNGKTVIDAI